MKTTISLIALLSNIDLGSIGDLLLRFEVVLVLLGMPLSLAAILWELRNAPEGYEDEAGFHFTQNRPSTRSSAGVARLRRRHAG